MGEKMMMLQGESNGAIGAACSTGCRVLASGKDAGSDGGSEVA